jgi:hypothetical protein
MLYCICIYSILYAYIILQEIGLNQQQNVDLEAMQSGRSKKSSACTGQCLKMWHPKSIGEQSYFPWNCYLGGYLIFRQHHSISRTCSWIICTKNHGIPWTDPKNPVVFAIDKWPKTWPREPLSKHGGFRVVLWMFMFIHKVVHPQVINGGKSH